MYFYRNLKIILNKIKGIKKNYKSIAEASNITGISQSSISLCCSGKYKKAGNYIWKKED